MAAILAQVLILGGMAVALWRIDGATQHGALASLAALAAYGALYAAIGVLMALWALRRPESDRHIAAQWHRYVALIAAVATGFPTVLRLLSEAAA